MRQRGVREILADSQVPAIDGVIVIDSKGFIKAIDNSALDLFGYSLAEIINQPLLLLMSNSQKKAHPSYLKRASNKGKVTVQKLHLKQTIIGKHKTGLAIPLAISVSADTSNDDIRFIGAIQDLRKHEAYLTRLYQDFTTSTAALNQRIEFENILNRYGNELISCSNEAFFSTMEAALHQVSLFLKLDHAYILQLSADASQAQRWAEWRRSPSLMRPFAERFNIPDSATFYNALTQDDLIALSDKDKKQDESPYQLVQQLSPNEFLSTRITPIYSDQKTLAGCIGFAILDPSHQLDHAGLSLLNLATQLLVNAWGRHQLILMAQRSEEKIKAKNKLLANKAALSETLLRSSNFLYLAGRKHFQKNVSEVLLQAALISGHQHAMLYFDRDQTQSLNNFIQQNLAARQLTRDKNPALIRYINKQLTHQDIYQLANLDKVIISKKLYQELKRTDIQGFSAIKLHRGGQCLGFACFYNSLAIINSNEEKLRFLQLTCQNLTSAIQNHAIQFELTQSQQQLLHVNQILSQQALQDTLTGLPNRRAFDHGILQEFDRAMRHDSTLTLLMCDIDHFKLYNDQFGHLQGDVCLQQVARILQSTFNRAGELSTRFGGEEFAIILPSVNKFEAQGQAQRLLERLEASQIEHASNAPLPYVTMSIGIAQFSPSKSFADSKALIDAADQALYQAKNNGRNQLAWAPEAE